MKHEYNRHSQVKHSPKLLAGEECLVGAALWTGRSLWKISLHVWEICREPANSDLIWAGNVDPLAHEVAFKVSVMSLATRIQTELGCDLRCSH